jgi:hypothetical protein
MSSSEAILQQVKASLRRAVDARASEMVLEHHREMSQAFDELVARLHNGQEYLRAYHQGRREERLTNIRHLRAAQRDLSHGSMAWKALGRVIRSIDPEGQL